MDRGEREFAALVGHPADHALAELRLRSPYMYQWLLEGPFAGPLSDPRLSRREREIATIAMLTALGTEPQLRVHLEAALHQGVTAEELRALCEHAAAYAGVPRALNALAVAHDVLADAAHSPALPVQAVLLHDHTSELVQVGTCGPPVVLVHALGLTWRMWEPVIHGLAGGRQVLAYDLRGHGRASEAPPPEDMAILARDLRQVLTQTGIAKAHIVGLSYGGAVAQAFAVRHPEAVESLTLAATTDRPFYSFESRAHAAERDGCAAQVAPSLSRWFTPAALAENGPGVRYARDCVLRGDPRQVAAAWRAFATLDTADALPGIDRPALLLAGELDASTPPQVMRPIADALPSATYVEMPGAPHMPTLETPKLVLRALDAFLPRSCS